MKSDGPMLLAVLFLAAGLFVIFDYGVGTAAFNAAYPLSGASLQLSISNRRARRNGRPGAGDGGGVCFWSGATVRIVGLFQPVASYRDGSSRLAVTRPQPG